MRRLWHKWKLYWATAKARKAKAYWRATVESMEARPKRESPIYMEGQCSHARTETAYCFAIVQQRMYEKLLNPEQDIPKATASDKAS